VLLENLTFAFLVATGLLLHIYFLVFCGFLVHVGFELDCKSVLSLKTKS
jgi:hypothetical protein